MPPQRPGSGSSDGTSLRDAPSWSLWHHRLRGSLRPRLPSARYLPTSTAPSLSEVQTYKTEYQTRRFRCILHTLLYPTLRPSQPLPHGPERPRPVGVSVLAFAHLGVGHRRPPGDEHGIVAEPTGTPRFLRQSPRNFTPEGAHGAVSLR